MLQRTDLKRIFFTNSMVFESMKFKRNRCVSQSIKIRIDLSIDECDLIDIDCTNQSVEIDDTLVSFIDLSWFLPISSTYIGGYISHQERKTSVQTVNFLTIELQLRVAWGTNNYHFFKKSLKKSYLFFKTRFKIFLWWLILARFVGAQFLYDEICHRAFQGVVTSRSMFFFNSIHKSRNGQKLIAIKWFLSIDKGKRWKSI